jgi:hypothetical protein
MPPFKFDTSYPYMLRFHSNCIMFVIEVGIHFPFLPKGFPLSGKIFPSFCRKLRNQGIRKWRNCKLTDWGIRRQGDGGIKIEEFTNQE